MSVTAAGAAPAWPARHLRTLLIALAGIDRIRFVEPVFLGDTIRLEGETTETTRMQDNKGLVRVQFRIRNQRGADVLTGRFQAMVGCRAASGTEGTDVTA